MVVLKLCQFIKEWCRLSEFTGDIGKKNLEFKSCAPAVSASHTMVSENACGETLSSFFIQSKKVGLPLTIMVFSPIIKLYLNLI